MNKDYWYSIDTTKMPVGEVIRIAATGGSDVYFTVEVIIPTYDLQVLLSTRIVSIKTLRSACSYWRNPKYYGAIADSLILNHWQHVDAIPQEINITVNL
jgi:hypothetical protein